MLNIYSWNLGTLIGIMAAALIIQNVLKPHFRKRLWICLHFLGAVISVFIILRYTVLGRQPSDSHQFMIMSAYSEEFFRELYMNLFLYFPLGLTCSQLMGKKTILLGFCLSVIIEIIQFRYGIGVAQVTDVLCNTLGASVAVIFQWSCIFFTDLL